MLCVCSNAADGECQTSRLLHGSIDLLVVCVYQRVLAEGFGSIVTSRMIKTVLYAYVRIEFTIHFKLYTTIEQSVGGEATDTPIKVGMID